VISPGELKALIYLLDDNDPEVLEHVESKLLSEGPSLIPVLEAYWEEEANPEIMLKLETLIQKLQQSDLAETLQDWYVHDREDLLKACIILARIQYPGLNPRDLNVQLEKIRLDAWIDFREDISPLEQIAILNHTMYHKHGFKGNTSDYHAPDNSFINRVLETHSGNPIVLASIYAIVAQRLNLPVFGVNLPQHFVLCFLEEPIQDHEISPFAKMPYLNPQHYGQVLFYINPFNQGQIFGKKNIDDFLAELKLDPRPSYYQPCTTLDMVRRMLRNLLYAFTRQQKPEKATLIRKLMRVLEMDDELDDTSDSKSWNPDQSA
jgi:regulator of sirC expression with transglutaminase-like and TPR domain